MKLTRSLSVFQRASGALGRGSYSPVFRASSTAITPPDLENKPIHQELSALTTKAGLLAALTPKQVVEQLDKFIIGQKDAKRAVAVALRNRWRRHQLSDTFRNEVIPKNILMIGPTGCGKVRNFNSVSTYCHYAKRHSPLISRGTLPSHILFFHPILLFTYSLYCCI